MKPISSGYNGKKENGNVLSIGLYWARVKLFLWRRYAFTISSRILPPSDSDSMTRTAAAARLEPRVDEWPSHHETPSLLSFTNREDKEGAAAKDEGIPDNLSELLTRKFREFFP